MATLSRMALTFQSLQQLQRLHPAWRLLRAEHAPLIGAFLDKAFVQPNVRTVAQGILESQLEDLLYCLRLSEGEHAFPRSAKAYLEEWAGNDKGWLRMFYPPGSDEPHFDLTPATEKALAWLENLVSKNFVGTESRLLTIFDLLKQMVFGAETEAEVRLLELERRKSEIETQIEAVRRGDYTLMDRVALQERYLQVVSTARELLSDFRAVEHNFRELDHVVREQIATWEGRKGELLQKIFGDRDQIADSDQGKSFKAFWDFLMSSESQDEFTSMLDRVSELDALKNFATDARFRRIHYDWLEAGRQTQRTVASLSSQLRRYLDSQVFLEDRRIIQIIDGIQSKAIQVRDQLPVSAFHCIADFGSEIHLPFERLLHVPKERFSFASVIQNADGLDIDSAALFSQFHVDKKLLLRQIHQCMRTRALAPLNEVVAQFPLHQGLAELVGYVAIASEDSHAFIDKSQEDHFLWTGLDGGIRQATLQRIVFTRKAL